MVLYIPSIRSSWDFCSRAGSGHVYLQVCRGGTCKENAGLEGTEVALITISRTVRNVQAGENF